MAKRKISLREKLVALVGALTLAFTAWGFGGVIAWSMHIMLAGGLVTFALAVMPSIRELRPKVRDREASRIPHPASRILKLLRFPGTYFALAFLLYLAIAALNPAWQIASDERGWWLEEMTPPLASWLPSSVAAPYEPMNAWRIFNLHLAAFSLALGLSVGLTRRKSVLFVLWAFAISVSMMAAVAIVQKYTAAETVLWTYQSENKNFWGSFFYRNQAVALLNWGIVTAGVLYFYHVRRSRDEGQSGGPHFLAFCLLALVAVSVGLALSRGGILFAAILTFAFLLLALWDFTLSTFQVPLSTMLPLAAILTLLVGAGLYQAHQAIDWHAIEERFGDIEATLDNADRDARTLSSKLTWEMAQDELWTGWGAGSFRYAFPMYQQKIPEMFHNYFHHRKQEWMGRKFFRYAHNDILQFLAEYGIIGCGLLLCSVLSFLFSGFRFQLSSIWLLLGCLALASHAFLDFIFHSPSVWVALISGLALAARLIQLQRRSEGYIA